MQKTEQAALQDVVKITKGEMGIVERNKKIERSDKKNKRKHKHKKSHSKLLDKETGLLIDIEG
jgi:hypothetical protein